jgi:hypothetical protein
MMISFAPAILELVWISLIVWAAQVLFIAWYDRRQRRRH